MNIQTRFSEKLPLKGTNFIPLLFFVHLLSCATFCLVLYLTFNPIRRILVYPPSKKSNIQRIIQTLIQFNVEPSHFSSAHNTLFLSSLWRKRKRERERRLLIHESSVETVQWFQSQSRAHPRNSVVDHTPMRATDPRHKRSSAFPPVYIGDERTRIYIYIFFISPRKTIHAPLFRYPPPVSQRLSKINIAPRIVIYTGKKIRYSVWSPLPALSWRGG